MSLLVLLGFLSLPAAADTFTVSNLNDSGVGLLRQAVKDANDNTGSDTIVFTPNLADAIVLTTGQIDINGNLTIEGPGASILAVSGNIASRILTVASGNIVTINKLTFKDGYTLYDGDKKREGGGAAIYNNGGNITINSSVFSENEHNHSNSYEALGGAIVNAENGVLTVNDSTLFEEYSKTHWRLL